MRVLVDTDVWLDVALGRDGHDASLAALYGCIDDGIIMTATATTLRDAFTIASAADGCTIAYEMLERLMDLAEILSVDSIVCRSGLQLRLSSYGDSITAACARTENIDLVITRNTEPFLSLGIPASTPDEFIEELGFTAIDLGAL